MRRVEPRAGDTVFDYLASWTVLEVRGDMVRVLDPERGGEPLWFNKSAFDLNLWRMVFREGE